MLGPVRLLRRLAAMVAVLGLALAGCGAGGGGSASSDDEPSGGPGDTAADAAADGGGDDPADGSADDGGVVEVALRDFEFAGLPAAVPAGTRFTVVNEAPTELHELVAFRLPEGEDRSVEQLTQLSPAELVGALGEPATVLLAEPGGPVIPAVGDGTLTEPGRYAVMCFIPTGVDPAEYLRVSAETEEGPPQVEGGGPPHFVQGMFAELTVD